MDARLLCHRELCGSVQAYLFGHVVDEKEDRFHESFGAKFGYVCSSRICPASQEFAS
jgi:hypothetical protein